MGKIIYLEDRINELHCYTPEMGQRKPEVRMEASLSYYGKHYFVDTPLELKGRGITEITRAALPPPRKNGDCMKKIKWTLNDIAFNRGNYRPVIAHFNNSKCWLGIPAMTTTSSARAMFRELAIAYGATTVELKYFYDDMDQQTETDVVDFLRLSTGYKFSCP